jgi:hypothetical protein
MSECAVTRAATVKTVLEHTSENELHIVRVLGRLQRRVCRKHTFKVGSSRVITDIVDFCQLAVSI